MEDCSVSGGKGNRDVAPDHVHCEQRAVTMSTKDKLLELMRLD